MSTERSASSIVVVDPPAREELLHRPEQAHIVQFYEAEDELIAAVCDYLVAGVLAGEPLVIVATPEHRAAFAAQLRERGFEAGVPEATTLPPVPDAREALATLTR